MIVIERIDTRSLGKLKNRLGPTRVNQALDRAGRKSAITLQRDFATYPRQRSGTRYIRTNRLMRGWQWRRTTRGVEIYNNVVYTKWVQVAQFQAWFHRGRWRTLEKMINSREQTINRFFTAELNKLYREAAL